ncbi:hypothetical protein [Halalkalibacterium ligniniphilum]|uniref:hypothetical protein n=1 Tax=Halalkalibacterium ligniniphilum TaxID=1134413 RepID=UPI000347B5C1
MINSEYKKEWQKLEQAREQFINEMSNNIYLYGLSPSAGRLYGTVLFSDHPMTLDEMSQSLGMSKTSMSTGIRSLLDANMVERVWQKGVRKDLYKTEEDWYKSFSTVFIKRWRSSVDNNLLAVKQMRSTLQELAETDNDDLQATIESDFAKLEHAEKYYHWLGEVIRLFESGEIYKLVPRKD